MRALLAFRCAMGASIVRTTTAFSPSHHANPQRRNILSKVQQQQHSTLMRISNHNNGLCTIRTGTGRAAAAATTTTITRRSLSSSADDSGGGEPPPIRQLGKLEMQEIFNDIDSDGREGSECVVIDVRGEDEIMFTGKISECVETLPLPIIAQVSKGVGMLSIVDGVSERAMEDVCRTIHTRLLLSNIEARPAQSFIFFFRR